MGVLSISSVVIETGLSASLVLRGAQQQKQFIET